MQVRSICLLLTYCIGMRVEWAKSLARAERWEEELLLVQEEMRRVLLFLEKKAMWWVSKSEACQNDDAELLAGIRAYAMKQAHILRSLASTFVVEWKMVCSDNGLPAPLDWPLVFLQIDHASKQIRRRPNRRKLRRRQQPTVVALSPDTP